MIKRANRAAHDIECLDSGVFIPLRILKNTLLPGLFACYLPNLDSVSSL